MGGIGWETRQMGANFDHFRTAEPAFARSFPRRGTVGCQLVFGDGRIRVSAFMREDELANGRRVTVQYRLVHHYELEARNVVAGGRGILEFGFNLIGARALTQLVSLRGHARGKCASSESNRCFDQRMQGMTSLWLRLATPLLLVGSSPVVRAPVAFPERFGSRFDVHHYSRFDFSLRDVVLKTSLETVHFASIREISASHAGISRHFCTDVALDRRPSASAICQAINAAAA